MHNKATHPNEKVAHHNDKDNKNKWKKTNIHCNFCNHDGHIEFKCFKKMEALEVATKKHNIHLDNSSTSSSRQTLSASSYASSRSSNALNASCCSSSSSSHE